MPEQTTVLTPTAAFAAPANADTLTRSVAKNILDPNAQPEKVVKSIEKLMQDQFKKSLDTLSAEDLLSDPVKKILNAPGSNPLKNAIATAAKTLVDFCKAIIKQTMEGTQKLMQRTVETRRKYAGNVVEVTPAALTVALAWANKCVETAIDKAKSLDFLKLLNEIFQKILSLTTMYHQNIAEAMVLRDEAVNILVTNYQNSGLTLAAATVRANNEFDDLSRDMYNQLEHPTTPKAQEFKDATQARDHVRCSNVLSYIFGKGLAGIEELFSREYCQKKATHVKSVFLLNDDKQCTNFLVKAAQSTTKAFFSECLLGAIKALGELAHELQDTQEITITPKSPS